MTDDLSLSELRPLQDGMFRFNDDGIPIALIAGQCSGCKSVVFPARKVCRACGPGVPIEPYVLSCHGQVYAATTVNVPSTLGHQPPYSYGYVDLPADNTRIFAPLLGDEGTRWEPGQPVKLTFREIPADKMRGVLGYAFAQIRESDDK